MNRLFYMILCILISTGMAVGQSSGDNQGITMKGKPITLLGTKAYIGEMAPDFTGIDSNMKEVKLSDFKGKVVVLSVFPSVDTKVCAAQTRRFNEEASGLGKDVVVLTLSKDLPFALERFCAAEGIDRIYTLSDYRESEFGMNYGFLIKENKLLARGVVVIDKDGKITYVQYVKDISQEPDYKAAIAAVKSEVKNVRRTISYPCLTQGQDSSHLINSELTPLSKPPVPSSVHGLPAPGPVRCRLFWTGRRERSHIYNRFLPAAGRLHACY